MVFSFLEYLFFMIEIIMFLYYANEESDDFTGGSTKTVKHLINNISIYWSSALQTWHQKCASQKEELLPW